VTTLLTRAAGSSLIRLLVTAAILGYLATRIDMRQAAAAVVRVDPWYLTAVLVLVALDRSVMILRWILLLRGSGVSVATRDAGRIFLVSSFVGSFLPAGVGADAARAYGLTRTNAAASEALASVAVDRILGILSLMAMAAFGAWILTSRHDASAAAPGRGGNLALGIAVLIAACVGVFWADAVLRAVTPRHLHDGPIARRILRVTDAVSRYRRRRGVLVHVMFWSIAVQVLRITQAYLLGLGLGLVVPFRYYLFFMPIGLLMLLLPISISGFGLPQGAIVWLLRPLGVADEQSFALSTLIVLTGLAGNLPGLALWLRQRRDSPV
jgi:glycosyltransferase 2 family protein